MEVVSGAASTLTGFPLISFHVALLVQENVLTAVACNLMYILDIRLRRKCSDHVRLSDRVFLRSRNHPGVG